MSEERLQKILARAGVASRRKAEELIRDGLVTINGQVAGIGDKADPARDAIKVDGKRIHPEPPHLYLLLNKPKGVVSTMDDPEGRPTVMEFVPPQFRKAVVPVGRLDFATEGLLLLTDDGDFAQRVAHPRYGCWKTYEVKVKGRPAEADLDRLRSGIVLEGKRTAPCRIEPRDTASRRPARSKGKKGADPIDPDNASWWMVELSEGRTRQIRDMFQRIGHPVQKLRRVAIGPVRDPNLPVGALRELTEREVERLSKAAKQRKEEKKTGKAGKEGPPARKRTISREAAEGEARRPAGARKAAGKPAAGKKAPAKKAAGARKASAAKPAAKRPAGKKTAAKRPAGKAPARKAGAGPRTGRTGGAGRGGARRGRG